MVTIITATVAETGQQFRWNLHHQHPLELYKTLNYFEPEFLFLGTDGKPNTERLLRAQRICQFIDATGLHPIPGGKFHADTALPRSDTDHASFWHHADSGTTVVVSENYGLVTSAKLAQKAKDAGCQAALVSGFGMWNFPRTTMVLMVEKVEDFDGFDDMVGTISGLVPAGTIELFESTAA